MEKILYYDCFSGISGDMNLAAMLDLGVPEAHLRDELKKINLSGYTLRIKRDSKNGIFGTRVDVDLTPVFFADKKPFHPFTQKLSSHHHRGYPDIVALINASELDTNTKSLAVKIFTKLAQAEATIHNQSVEQVHFHEVGAVDSIVDIVGAAICLNYLNVDRVLASSVELGGGFVKCQHGTIPVPAPAVTRLLEGVPVKSGAVNFETTTPTGAAILASCVNEFTDNKNFTITKTSWGVGHRDMDIPNLLRLFLGTQETKTAITCAYGTEKAVLLECNIDDMSPEIHSHLFDKIFSYGAQDVWLTPIIMKKGRSAITLSVLCAIDLEAEISRMIFTETTTLGLRRLEIGKLVLERKSETVDTSLGKIRIKRALLDGKPLRLKAEYEDLHDIAVAQGMSLLEVQTRIEKEIE